MKKLLLLLVFCSAAFLVQAQNTTLLDPKEPELPLDFNSLCNESITAAGDVNKMIKEVYSIFRIAPLSPRLNTIGLDISFIDAFGKNFFKDRKQVKAVYKAAFPVFLAQFKRMTPGEQKEQLRLIEKAIDYTKNFDLAKEKADLDKITKAFKRFDREKGSIHAFIYRRISKEEISQKDCLFWLKKIQKQLKGHLSTAKTAEDEYLLTKVYSSQDQFVRGQIVGTDTYAIFEKKGNDYQLMKLEDGLTVTKKVGLLKKGYWVLLKTKDGSMRIGLLQKDQAFFSFDIPKMEEESFWIKEFYEEKAWGIVNKGMPSIYALNEKGEIEEMMVDEKDRKNKFFLFSFKSGKTMLLNHSYSTKSMETVQNPKQLYRGSDASEYWIIDEGNRLYYFYLYKTKEPRALGVKDLITSLNVIDKTKTIIKYENDESELFLLDWKKNITEVDLPKGLDIKAIKRAWGDNYYITLENNLIGVIDKKGKIVLALEYESIKLNDGIVYIEKSGKFGLANKKGEIVLTPEYESIKLNNGRVYIEKSGKWGLADRQGKVLLAPNYQTLSHSKIYSRDDEIFRALLPPHFRKSTLKIYLNDKKTYYKFSLEKEGKFGLIEESGKIIFEAAYGDLKPFIFDPKDKVPYFLFNIEKDGPIGLMDERGKVLLKPVYNNLLPLRINSDDKRFYAYFNTEKSKLRGLIDQNAKVIIPAEYTTISQLKEVPDIFRAKSMQFVKYRPDIFMVTTRDNKKGVFDLNGRAKLAANYSSLEHVPSKKALFIFQKTAEGKKGVVDLNGKVLLDAEYNSLRYSIKNDGTALFIFQKEAGQNFGVIDAKAKEIHPEVFIDLQAVELFFNEVKRIKLKLYTGTIKSVEDKSETYLYSENFEQPVDFSLDELQYLDTIVQFDPETFEEILKVVSRTYYYFMPSTYYQFFQVKHKGKATLLDFEGKVILPPVWDEITWYHNHNYFIVREGKSWGLVDRSNKLRIPTNNEAIVPCYAPFGGYYILEQQKNSYNIADSTGKKILSKTYSEILTYDNIPLIFVGQKQKDENLKYALYSKEGKALTAFEFSPRIDTLISFDPDTFEEVVNLINEGPIVLKNEKTYNAKKKTICLLRDGKEVIYNFEGKEVD